MKHAWMPHTLTSLYMNIENCLSGWHDIEMMVIASCILGKIIGFFSQNESPML